MVKIIAKGQFIDRNRTLQRLQEDASELAKTARAHERDARLAWKERDGVLRAIKRVEAEEMVDAVDVAYPKSVQQEIVHTLLTGLTVDFEGATTYKQQVFRIAQAAEVGAVLNATEVAKYLVGTMHTSRTVDNVRPSMFRVFDEQSTIYEKVGPGNWTLKQESEDVRYDNEEEVHNQTFPDWSQPAASGVGSPEADHRG